MPVVIFVHGLGDTLLSSGAEMRQMAEVGLATVNVNYDQMSRDNFNAQFRELHKYVGRQSWANGGVAWVGYGLGAEWMLQFALEHPELQPDAMVQVSGKLPQDLAQKSNASLPSLKSKVWLIHAEHDVAVSKRQADQLHDFLVSLGVTLTRHTVPEQNHDFEPNRALLFRVIGEHCLQVLHGSGVWKDYESVTSRARSAAPIVLFWVPAALWAGFCYYSGRSKAKETSHGYRPARWEIALKYAAAAFVVVSVTVCAIHIGVPRMRVNVWTASLAECFLIAPALKEDFKSLKSESFWAQHRLSTLLTHVELANYNRGIVNWTVDDPLYRQFVLSPVIAGYDRELNWRRALWESFYPRIRKEHSPSLAARIVARHLRERVTVVPEPLDFGVDTVWLKQIADAKGFEATYVAALRSAGIAARLNSEHRAEFWDGVSWQLAPRPVLERSLSPETAQTNSNI